MGKKQKKKATSRKKEAVKAQFKTRENTRNLPDKTQSSSVVPTIKKEKVNPTHTLPIKEIKHDLIKTGAFAVFAITVLVLLHTSNTTYNDILKFLKFL